MWASDLLEFLSNTFSDGVIEGEVHTCIRNLVAEGTLKVWMLDIARSMEATDWNWSAFHNLESQV
jgi:hypothetical protein